MYRFSIDQKKVLPVFYQEATNEELKGFKKKRSLDDCGFMHIPFTGYDGRIFIFGFD
jgi:hypothetical protein